MTGSSETVRPERPNPLGYKDSLPVGKAVSWKPVVALLILLPLGFALLLSSWLGTPRERVEPAEVFALMRLPEVPVRRLDSMAYGRLIFTRLELEDEPRKGFLRSLSGLEVDHGRAQTPTSFDLDRHWWTPPKEEGTRWRRRGLVLWNPDSQPDIFYVVVEQGVDGRGSPTD